MKKCHCGAHLKSEVGLGGYYYIYEHCGLQVLPGLTKNIALKARDVLVGTTTDEKVAKTKGDTDLKQLIYFQVLVALQRVPIRSVLMLNTDFLSDCQMKYVTLNQND